MTKSPHVSFTTSSLTNPACRRAHQSGPPTTAAATRYARLDSGWYIEPGKARKRARGMNGAEAGEEVVGVDSDV